MTSIALDPQARWHDLLEAIEFAQRQFRQWASENIIKAPYDQIIAARYATLASTWAQGAAADEAPPVEHALSMLPADATPTERMLARWEFVLAEINRHQKAGRLSLYTANTCALAAESYVMPLRRKLGVEDLPEVLPVEDSHRPKEATSRPKDAPKRRKRPVAPPPGPNFMELLLSPRSIQWLLGMGGALMVVGLVILLWVNNFFQPPTIAIALGVSNVAVLAGGIVLMRKTRYQLAGRALTLLACLVMPLNLWYYHANNLITVDGHLWVAALIVSAFYAAAALVLDDEMFVYVFVGGITLTGMLMLADWPPSPQKFWEIAAPATMLIGLGLVCIHLVMAFPDQHGAFGRKRFGMAFFWSGQIVLLAGLALLLGATIAGDWLYDLGFKYVYRSFQATPSPVVGELRWLALMLVVAGAYGYVFSDLFVKRSATFVSLAAAMLLWAAVLILQLLQLHLGLDALIAILAGAALVVNLGHAFGAGERQGMRALPVLGLLLALLALGIGAFVYLEHLGLRAVWVDRAPAWSYVGAMLLTAVACRVGAHLNRHTAPTLATGFFFATAMATLVAGVALLAAMGLNTWQRHAPILMLVPIAYMVAAHLYKDQASARPLAAAAHAATAVMLISSLATAFQGFTQIVEGQRLNLALALFFAEATVFYALAAVYRQETFSVDLAALMACAALWQVLTYLGVPAEAYTMAFALVGLALLLSYRFAIVEQMLTARLAGTAFRSANVILSLSFVAAALRGLSRLAATDVHWSFVVLSLSLMAISALAVALVGDARWRRWYVVTTIGMGLLAGLGVHHLILRNLGPWQKLEMFSIAVGTLLLIAGHIGWRREKDRENDLVSVSLFLGSILTGLPLAIATLIDRSRGDFSGIHFLNELGFLAVSLLLLASGFVLQLRSTTLVGAILTILYFVTLLIYVPWSRLNYVATFILVGGGVLFGTGLLLSVYRDRLLTLPDRVRNREGLFRVLSWR